MNIDSIRTLIRDNPRTSDGYPQRVRDAVGRYAQHQRDRGVRWHQLEKELGISGTSMRIWISALQGARFEQIVVVDDPPAHRSEPTLVITNPAGFTLTGCTLDQAAALLQSLR